MGKNAVYTALSWLPAKVGSALGFALMLSASLWPDKARVIVGGLMTTETIQQAAIPVAIMFACYWLLLWALKPKTEEQGTPQLAQNTHGDASPIIQGDGAHVHYGNVTNIHAPPGRDLSTDKFAKERAQLSNLDKNQTWLVLSVSPDEETMRFAAQIATYLKGAGVPLEQDTPGQVMLGGDQFFDIARLAEKKTTIFVGRRA